MVTSELLCGGGGFIAQCGGGCFPGEIDSGGAGAVEIFEFDGVRFRVGEGSGCEEGRASLRGLAGVLEDQFVIEIEAEGLRCSRRHSRS